MRLTRCYLDADLQPGHEVVLSERATQHLLKVLRLRVGDPCVLFNGDGRDYDARILSADKRSARAQILDARQVDNESPLHITLLQGVARGEKMDLVLQKATELGVAAMMPVFAERSEVKLDPERARKRAEHWHSVLVAACEQSGRARLPTLTPPRPLAEALRHLPDPTSLRLILDPQGEHTVADLPASPVATVVTLAIGPEGGWSPRDREALRGHGFTGLRLGPRILRTETAGLAAVAALQARLGDL